MTAPDERQLETLAAQPIDDTDIAALARIAALYTKLDPVPSKLLDRIAFGITLDALNAELAELERSSGLVGVRADETSADTVTFTSQSLTAMVTITSTSAETARLDGWITPGGVRDVEVRTAGGSMHTAADDDGRFVVEDVTRGLVQFRFGRPEGGQPVMTPALEI
ncbi:MAG TPA: hypothetical protein VE442_07450 [Jatrophihabitans sp.]|jgi:hypothetical protein|nr:hypothetical protein [Jatrophihabitans sp.]